MHSTTTTTTPAEGCHGDFDGGTVSPGATVKGTLTLSNGCKFTGTVDVSLNGKTLQKTPDATGAVAVSVKINSMTSGVLDDPVDVPLHQGINTVVVSGQGQTQSGASAGTVTINATFNVQPAATPTTQVTTVTVTPVTTATTTTTTSGSGLPRTGLNLLAMVAVALVAIALGAHAMATQWAVAGDTYISPFDKGDRRTVEHVMLTAAAYILGPPPGRHSSYAGPRGLIPILRDWAGRIG
ncbi:MAG: hypothetical protein JO148_04200 [Acidimicrobiia bacterium]|nr:hypothetical protein [Acidimicrobiia bacterium]